MSEIIILQYCIIIILLYYCWGGGQDTPKAFLQPAVHRGVPVDAQP